MIYTLDTIPLGRFIDVYLGDINKAVEGEHSEEETKAAAERLSHEYMEIVGGKSVAVLLSKRNEALKIAMRGAVLGECKSLVIAGMIEDACRLMKCIGYTLKPDKDALMKRIESVIASDGYKMAKMNDSKEVEPLSRDSFIKERVAIMSHLKMHIDENVFRAKEYAYLVKQVNDEVEAMMKTVKK